MPTADAEPALVEDVGQLEHLDEPPGRRPREGARERSDEESRDVGRNRERDNNGPVRARLMKPLVVLALPGMYLFYKYSQYRREQRELSRRRITERELQHLHHKIDKLLTKLEENEPELASSQEDEAAQNPGQGGPPQPPMGLPPGGMPGGGGNSGMNDQAGGQISGRQQRSVPETGPDTFFFEVAEKLIRNNEVVNEGVRGRRSPQGLPQGPPPQGGPPKTGNMLNSQ